MLDFVKELILNPAFAYSGMFVVLLAAGLGVPIPEDIPLILGGVMVGLGHADLLWMNVVALVGVMTGDSFIFLAGKRLGPAGMDTAWMKRLLTPARRATVELLFAKHGNWIVFFARFIAGIRAPLFFSSGAFGVSYTRFFLLDLFAAVISVPLWIWLGKAFAANYEQLFELIDEYKPYVIAGGAVLVILAVAAILWYRRRLQARATTPPAPDPPETPP